MQENKNAKMNILVLTKSTKKSIDSEKGGLCIAGIDLVSNKLVRLVADGGGREITKNDFKIGKNEIQVGDKIEIEGSPAPLKIQTENVILNKIDKVAEHYDSEKINKAISNITNNGDLLKTQECAILHKNISTYNKSLMVAEVSDFKTEIITNNEGKPKTKASFSYKNKNYNNISVTDADYFKISQTYKKCKIVISIPEYQWNGLHFKFIAKVFPAETSGE